MTPDGNQRKICQSRNALQHKRTKIMSTEEIYNFPIDNEETKIVKDFASVINSDGDNSHKIKRRLILGRATIEELRKFIKAMTCL